MEAEGKPKYGRGLMIYSLAQKNNLDPQKEDFRTSTIVGILLFLPDSLLWSILREACFGCRRLPGEAGELLHYDFWPHWSADNTSNNDYVEPDVFLSFENADVIIEAKRFDESGQYFEEWKNELIAYSNEYTNGSKPVFLIALGGNGVKKETEVFNLGGKSCFIVKCSWLGLHKVIKNQIEKEEGSSKRILESLLIACNQFGFRNYGWLDERVNLESYDISSSILNEIINHNEERRNGSKSTV